MSSKENTFIEKRDSLQSFLRQQLIGPGAFDRKYHLLAKWQSQEFAGRILSQCCALDNVSEVIAEVPAYQYSSGILFPMVELQEEHVSEQHDESVETSDDEVIDTNLPEDGFSQDQSESISSKNQNYPNTMGLSIAVGGDCDFSADLSLHLKFRTYEKVRQQDLTPLLLGHWIQFDAAEISALITEQMGEIFRVIERDGNHFVLCAEQVDLNDHLYTIDYVYMERVSLKILLPLIQSLYPEGDFFEKKSSHYGGVNYQYHYIYQDKLIDRIHSDFNFEGEKKKAMFDLLTALERYNKIKAITTELKTMYRRPSRKNQPTPVWSSTNHSHVLTLPQPKRRSGTIRDNIVLDEERNLYLNYQYLFHPKGLIYVKLIVVNRSLLILGKDEPPQLNKKDIANRMACFGVELHVSETKPKILKPYNPPNLITIDQEDNLNKILYRDFKDFGEGYNTSVEWSSSQDSESLRSVRTEYLPQEDTPDIDFEPTKVVDRQLVKIVDKGVLNMKTLSTLSNFDDDDLKVLLENFVNAYGKWIEEKNKIASEDTGLKPTEIKLLDRQLKGCTLDHRRMSRNLTLLFDDYQALTAFRLMNTAMYMQLKHSKELKIRARDSSKIFLPTENNVNFYIACSDEFHWRSFQLAFIILNLDGFIRPNALDKTIPDVFGTGWPERNEIADLVWFPTGGGKTEAYLGIIGFCIAYRRFKSKGSSNGDGTAILMRYTLRLLTLQQFQRATLLICALEVIRKAQYPIPRGYSLGAQRISIGLFVGGGSLPNSWKEMSEELGKLKDQLEARVTDKKLNTKLPLTECPWCGTELFINASLDNLSHHQDDKYAAKDSFSIMCNQAGCIFHAPWPNEKNGIPIRIFDDDIYKHPPTLLFGTVDKFAALANNVEIAYADRSRDSRRFFGKGSGQGYLPPELIIQDELHLLLGPLGSAVGLFEKAVDECCTVRNPDGTVIRPKIITSTATARNTDKQIFALFNRRSEVFPKQGIKSEDSFFACYKRNPDAINTFFSKRRYVGVLPIGKTQVWMQLRIASIALAHRVKYIREVFGTKEVLESGAMYQLNVYAMNYFHTVLSYFNSLKEVGKTQSQLTHYLPGDLDLVLRNTIGWTVIGKLIKPSAEIQDGELTGRLNGEDVKGNLARIQRDWKIWNREQPPELVVSTNMISVGIDVSRFNTMIINSMPRNIAEYIQASSRVAREREGIVFTVHHPFRSRDISHYQRFKEFHEKFYSYVEPISVTPFAEKALDRYLAMFLAAMIRHDEAFSLQGNKDAGQLTANDAKLIKEKIMNYLREIHANKSKLNTFLKTRDYALPGNVEGIMDDDELLTVEKKLTELLTVKWLDRLHEVDGEFRYRQDDQSHSLFAVRREQGYWNVKYSLREIAPTVVIKTVQQ